MHTITLTNDFHGTSCRVRLHGATQLGYLSQRTIRRAQLALCGIDGCTCGDMLGCRPSQLEPAGRVVGGWMFAINEK